MSKKKVHLALIFKDFAAWIRSSCVGLNVAGFTTAKVLQQAGFDVAVYPVRHNVDIVHALDAYNETHEERLTHVVISAPWLSVFDLEALLQNFSDIQFVILSHSNVGFLQADPRGVRLLRAYAKLSEKYPNIKVGGNNKRFTDWFQQTYNHPAVLLPNLYPIDNAPTKKWQGTSPIKIGMFGAARPYKNFMTAAAASVLIHNLLDMPVELHMSCGGESDAYGIGHAIAEMCEGLPGVKLVQHNWSYWDQFVKLVAQMDLLMQVSYTESFNMVTADGILSGVPSVVSPAIAWAPDSWKAEPDSVVEVANVGMRLLNSTAREGVLALQHHNRESLVLWEHFLLKQSPSRLGKWLHALLA